MFFEDAYYRNRYLCAFARTYKCKRKWVNVNIRAEGGTVPIGMFWTRGDLIHRERQIVQAKKNRQTSRAIIQEVLFVCKLTRKKRKIFSDFEFCIFFVANYSRRFENFCARRNQSKSNFPIARTCIFFRTCKIFLYIYRLFNFPFIKIPAYAHNEYPIFYFSITLMQYFF